MTPTPGLDPIHPLADSHVDDAPVRRTGPAAILARVALALVLILGSGGVRWWQGRRLEARLIVGRDSPFKLSTVPLTLGPWVGSETQMDPDIVRATGSTDLVTRRYVDQRTGDTLDVILLYGPTSDIFIHSPELCYPKAGYATAGDPLERSIRLPGGETVPVRSVAYAKGDTVRDVQEVYFSWRFAGRWSTSATTPKEAERIPGMYKVQISRRLLPRESRTEGNPCVSLLEAILPDLEARIAGHNGPGGN